ncbi:hypothetical protein ACWIGD_30460 [Streptomyces albidoflavus]|uniref:hypothetical protein n=1 Tax=Streptomyces sp. BV333 TaxID=2849673 RepID=UPI001C2E1B1D|nr:hypothetical protein [Streptomyces sp. BV333]MBV1957264.1 hypothetical protein [Streptomyces sp. BV333]
MFRDTFATAAELSLKVVQKIKELDDTDSPLGFAPLMHAVDPRWIYNEQSSSPWSGVMFRCWDCTSFQ